MSNSKQKVYLAGGMKSDWAKKVMSCSDNIIWVNPKDKDETGMSVNQYGTWDLHFIWRSDIVFVYVEKDNPSCIGLSCEAGYAKGLGKTVILVLEESNVIKNDYLSFITQMADITFDNIEDGIKYLKTFAI